jgi:hypothetical protein
MMFLGDPAQIGPEPWFNVRGYPAFPILGAEDDMIMEAGVGVRHKRNLRNMSRTYALCINKP